MILRLLWISKLPSTHASVPTSHTLPFLYAKLNTSNYLVSQRPKGLIPRLLKYGEDKWYGLSQFPSRSIKGRIYQVGCRLVDRIPMQERMLWRVYGYCSIGSAKLEPPVPQIEYSPSEDAQLINSQVKLGLEKWAAEHSKWRLIHGITIIPAVLLSVLPFVKLWLAWEIFRTVTHHRAYLATSWLRKGLARRNLLTPNSQLLENQDNLADVDTELPSIIRKL